jgi:hypothetical protein
VPVNEKRRDQIVTNGCHLVSTPVHMWQLNTGPACIRAGKQSMWTFPDRAFILPILC